MTKYDRISIIVVIIGVLYLGYIGIQLDKENQILRLDKRTLELEKQQLERSEHELINITHDVRKENANLRERIKTEIRVKILPKTINISDYTFNFIDMCGLNEENGTVLMSDNGTHKCLGWTNGKDNVNILNERKANEEIDTCNHEVLHNIIGMSNNAEEEKIVTRIAPLIMTKECAILEVKIR